MGRIVNNKVLRYTINILSLTMSSTDFVHRTVGKVTKGVLLIFVVALSLFVWRVVHYANLIRSGALESATLPAFFQERTASKALASLPITPGPVDVTSMDDPTLRANNPTITIVEFGDFSCPFSKKASTTLHSIVATYRDKISYTYRDFPISDLHPDAKKAAEAAACAQDQGKFWEYHDKLYLNQEDLRESRLIELAKEVNLNVLDFKQCLSSGRKTAEIEQDIADGVAAGVRATPTFFINNNRVEGAIPETVFAELIKKYAESSK